VFSIAYALCNKRAMSRVSRVCIKKLHIRNDIFLRLKLLYRLQSFALNAREICNIDQIISTGTQCMIIAKISSSFFLKDV